MDRASSKVPAVISLTNLRAVLSGHVHDMQRFTRRYKDREIPYVIDGRGGYANTERLAHKLQKDEHGHYPQAPTKVESAQDPALDLDLEYYDQENAGFLRVSVTAQNLTIESFSVPFDGEFEDAVRDSVTVTRDGRLAGGAGGGGGGSHGRRRRH